MHASLHTGLNTMRTEREKMDGDARYTAAVKNYETAVRQMQRQNYEKASEILEKLVAEGPVEVADRARVYLRFCGLKLQPAGRPLRSAEEFYVAGVSDLNAGKLDRAIEHLNKAEKLDPGRSEIHYALASGYALRGDTDAALRHLEKCIHLDPQSRIQARHDEDFQPVSHDPRFTSLINAGRIAAAGSAS
jgi:tetratricopeptide (TPR) repeat protein